MMRKHYLLVAGILAACMMAASCQKDVEGTATLTATIDDYQGDDSKLHVVGRYMCWDNNDKININGDEYTLTISGTTASISGVTAADSYDAIVPASTAVSHSAGSYEVEFPASQIYEESDDSYQKIEAPMVAHTTNGNLAFRNIGGLIRLIVPQWSDCERINWIKVMSCTEGVYLAKTATINTATRAWSNEKNNSYSVLLFFPDTYTEAGGTYYIPVAPFSGAKLMVIVNYKSTTSGVAYNKYITMPSSNASIPANRIAMISIPMTSWNSADVSYSVAASGTGSKVNFAPGNLYCNASGSTPTGWKFEANQYDEPLWSDGTRYAHSASADGNYLARHLGHFYWSTSASVATAVTYSDPSATTSDAFFLASNSNACVPNWHTLTGSGTAYLTSTRDSASNKKKSIVTVCGQGGMIICPDAYTPTNFSTTTSYSISDWALLEAKGCIFLPVAGVRIGSTCSYAGICGEYWLSDGYDASGYLYGAGLGIGVPNGYHRNAGFSVRLVQNLN